MKVKTRTQTIFVFMAGLLLVLSAYLLTTKTAFHPQLFVTTCREVLNNVKDHVHFNYDGLASSLTMAIGIIGISLVVKQLARFVVVNTRLKKLTHTTRIPDKLGDILNKHSIKAEMISMADTNKLAAYTTGIFSSKIVISKGLIQRLSSMQLEAVVLHELHHARSRHVLWLLFSRLISSLFFFIPLFSHLADRLRKEFELCADAFVIETQNTQKYLCESLALNLQYTNRVIPHFATSPIETRVDFLLGHKPAFNHASVKTIAVSVFSFILMLTFAFLKPNTAAAHLDVEPGTICRVDTGCQTKDCANTESESFHNFTPAIPVSFSPISSGLTR
ncbi:M48 family metalloprotease [Candidatus Nomurabacteria bacterium]|nr:M48 family metalloprotease [Candidatus Nomurabacteria bacterium]